MIGRVVCSVDSFAVDVATDGETLCDDDWSFHRAFVKERVVTVLIRAGKLHGNNIRCSRFCGDLLSFRFIGAIYILGTEARRYKNSLRLRRNAVS